MPALSPVWRGSAARNSTPERAANFPRAARSGPLLATPPEAPVASVPLFQRRPRLARERVDHRGLVARAKVGHPFADLRGGHFLDPVAEARLQAGETEVQLILPPDAAGKIESFRITAVRAPLDQRSARIPQPQQLRAFVQSLPGGVVPRAG